MSWNAKLIPTEQSPNQLMISAGRKAGNAIKQALKLSADPVRVSNNSRTERYANTKD